MSVCAADTIGAPGHLTLENIGGAPYTSEFVGGQFHPSLDSSSLNYSPLLSGGGKRKKKRKSRKLKKSNKSRLVSKSKKSKSRSNKKVYKRKSLSKKMFRKKSKKSRKSLK